MKDGSTEASSLWPAALRLVRSRRRSRSTPLRSRTVWPPWWTSSSRRRGAGARPPCRHHPDRRHRAHRVLHGEERTGARDRHRGTRGGPRSS